MPKRKRKSSSRDKPSKKPRADTAATTRNDHDHDTPTSITHPVLSSFYPRVTSLRAYLLSALAAAGASKTRRRGLAGAATARDAQVDLLLDATLVGVRCDGAAVAAPPAHSAARRREHDFQEFTQQLLSTASSTRSTAAGEATPSMAQLVDFTVWLLFHKQRTGRAPPHLLCQGFVRSAAADLGAGAFIPGVASVAGNEHVRALKGAAWARVCRLVGARAESVLVEMLVNCGVFVPVCEGSGAVCQVSGVPLSELGPVQTQKMPATGQTGRTPLIKEPKLAGLPGRAVNPPSSLTLVRHRVLYARSTLNAGGLVRFGLRHIHVLNRFTDCQNDRETVHVAKYIFPRQFGLHNVFTSQVDPKETAQPLKDYTLREEEIAMANLPAKIRHSRKEPDGKPLPLSIPKRLRGKAVDLVRKLRVRHQRCAYKELLLHYCPLSPDAEKSSPGLSQVASSHAQVSAFCRAAIAKVFPREFLDGEGSTGHNWRQLMDRVDDFIRARRFESLTLDYIMRGIRVGEIDWLRPPESPSDRPMARTDHAKRSEVLAELLYYMFDSFLIPLIRCHFYVTESSSHRNQLFYFRHDVWRRLTESATGRLKSEMLEEMKSRSAVSLLNERSLGCSHVRFLPKSSGMRPIMNLKRRPMVLKNGVRTLGRSINSTVAPVFNILNFEKDKQPRSLGSSVTSVAGIFEPVRTYRAALAERGMLGQKLYFAKVDVQSCFDSLPQDLLVELTRELLKSSDYSIARHAEFKPVGLPSRSGQREFAKPRRRFHSVAWEAGTTRDSKQSMRGAAKAKGTVFVKSVMQQGWKSEQVVGLLDQHVRANVVRIGKRYYRQKKGIPQGSILSSMLCNIGYADFERRHLGFLADGPCLFLRLIDDFLLITPDKGKAELFLRTMHEGNAKYGISIKTEKTLTNFECELQGRRVDTAAGGAGFPYCGILIDQHSLDIMKERAGVKHGSTSGVEETPTTAAAESADNDDTDIGDSLTVDVAKSPGLGFRRRMLNAFKVQMHSMLLDQAHNSARTVLENAYGMLAESAMRAVHYIKSVSSLRRAAPRLLMGVLDTLVQLLGAKLRGAGTPRTGISRAAIQWIATQAYLAVLGPRQTRFGGLVAQLQRRARASRPRAEWEARLASSVIKAIAGPGPRDARAVH